MENAEAGRDLHATIDQHTEVHIDKVVVGPQDPALARRHQLRPPVADFTGRRKELEELTQAVTQSAGAIIGGVQGMGGVGKTELALKLAEGLVEEYRDAQIFLDLKGVSQQKGVAPQPLSPAEAMAHVVRSYHPETKLPESQQELQGLYHSVLHGQRALLLMDNAADADQVRPLIPPAGCLLLVTSREHFALPGMKPISLDAMPLDDACKLLLSICDRIVRWPRRWLSFVAVCPWSCAWPAAPWPNGRTSARKTTSPGWPTRTRG